MEKFDTESIMYKKIDNIKFDVDLLFISDTIDNSNSTKGYSPKKDDTGLYYFESPDQIVDHVKQLLPEFLKDKGDVSLCKITGGAVPHRDHDCLCKINFYVKSGNAKTYFFNDPGKPGYSYNNDNQYNIYSVKDHRLSRHSDFVASDGDVFLLDTSEIHAVTLPAGEDRIIVSVSFNLPFEEVLSILY